MQATVAQTKAMKALLAGAFLFLICGRPIAAAEADAIAGFWEVESGDAVIHIYQRGVKYYGALAALKESVYTSADGADWAGKPVVDRHNPDPGLRNRRLLGLEILSDLRFDGGDSGEWRDGRIYNSEDGKEYRCNVWLVDSDTLHLRGFIGVPLFGKTTTWTRVNPKRYETDEQRKPIASLPR